MFIVLGMYNFERIFEYFFRLKMASYFYTYSVVTGYHILIAGKKMTKWDEKKTVSAMQVLFDLCPQWGEILFSCFRPSVFHEIFI